MSIATSRVVGTPSTRSSSSARTAREIAEKIAAKSPAMVKLAKEALTGIEDGNLEDKYRWEQGFTLQAYTMGDSQESRDAFVEKRELVFRLSQFAEPVIDFREQTISPRAFLIFFDQRKKLVARRFQIFVGHLALVDQFAHLLENFFVFHVNKNF